MSKPATNNLAVVADNDENFATYSSGNIWKDFGRENSTDALNKARLVIVIRHRLEKLKLSQTKAASLIGISQPDVSKLLRGQVSGYTLDRLFGFLRILGSDVRISVSVPDTEREGKISLLVDVSAA